MKQITLRKSRPADVPAIMGMIRASMNTLREQAGLSVLKQKITTPDPIVQHIRKTDPDGCYVACLGDRIVGYGSALIREREWYLADLFVAPTHWSKGIGRKLLAKTLKYGEGESIKRHALCTFSYNAQAMALYSSYGWTPQEVIVCYGRKREDVPDTKPERRGNRLTIVPITDFSLQKSLNRLDRQNRAIARPEEHKFWIDSEEQHPLGFFDGKKFVGYSVITNRGFVSPVSAISADKLLEILDLSIARAAEYDFPGTAVWCPGSNVMITRYLLEHGFRIREVNLLMCEKRFASPDAYLPADLSVF